MSSTPNDIGTYISRTTLTGTELSVPITINVSLPFRSLGELKARVDNHERLTTAQLDESFFPLVSTYQRVSQWLISQGLTVGPEDPNHMLVSVSGTIPQISAAFQTTFAHVTSPKGEFTSAISPPMIPSSIADAILGITGLQPHLNCEPLIIPSTNHMQCTNLGSNPPSYTSQSFYMMTPADIRALYNAPSSLTGSGQTVAIIMNSSVSSGDLSSYNTYTGNSFTGTLTVRNVGSPPPYNDSNELSIEEVNLDVETVAGVAPASNIRVYTMPTYPYIATQDVESALNMILSDIRNNVPITVVSMSFGGPEDSDFTPSDLTTIDQLFLATAALGVTNVASSGDSGSSGPVGTGQPDFPASDPYVTSVGGTSYHTYITQSLTNNVNNQLSTGNYLGETVYSEFPQTNYSNVYDYGSGGGVSRYFPRPAWQIGNGTLLGSETGRCVPDISGPWGEMINHSSASDTVGNATWEAAFGIFFTNVDSQNQTSQLVLEPVGGTSLAAPSFAGVVALINQTRANGNSGSIGFLNPWLYQIADNYGIGGQTWNGFNDVTGSNPPPNILGALPAVGSVVSYWGTYGNNNGAYTVTPGYDLCTGLGTPNIGNLVGLLGTGIYAVQPESQTVAVGGSVVFSAFAEINPYEIAPTSTTPGVPPYQWYWNGQAISVSSNPYAQSPQLLVSGSNTQLANNGDQYYCVVTLADTNVKITTSTATLSVVNTTNIGHLVNLSTRGYVDMSTPYGGYGPLIGGFYVSGTGTYPLLVRADGPTLGLAPFYIPGALPDPVLTVKNLAGTTIASNTIWGGSNVLKNAFSDLYAFPWTAGSYDSAVLFASGQNSPALASLALNSSGSTGYTQQIVGSGGDNGVAMIELFDANPVIGATWTPGMPFLCNLSTRGVVGTGYNILIGGFYLGGSTSRTLLIRATGPTLSSEGLPSTLVLPDPQITLINLNGQAFAANEVWNNNPLIAAEASAAYAYPWPAASNDSAMVVTLPPGGYTIKVVGASGDTGIALFEIFLLP